MSTNHWSVRSGSSTDVAAVAARHHELVRLDALDEPQRLQVGEHAGARGDTIKTPIGCGHGVVERGVQIHDVDERQAVPLAHLVVVEVVRRRDLDAAAAESRIDVAVGDDGEFALGERQAHRAADQGAITLIVRMYGNGGIAEQRFRARGRNHEMAAAIAQRVAQVPETSGFLFRMRLPDPRVQSSSTGSQLTRRLPR